MSCAGLSVSVGVFIVFLMSSMMSWRTVSLVCVIFPIVTFVALFFVRNYYYRYNHLKLVKYKLMCFVGSGNTNLAIIQITEGRCSKIVAMATRMGAREGCSTGIRRPSTLWRGLKCMRRMRKEKYQMHSSSANDQRQITWYNPKANNETFLHHYIHVLHSSIQRDVCDATIYNTDFVLVRSTFRPEPDYRDTGFNWNSIVYSSSLHCPNCGQATHIFVFDCSDVYNLFCAEYVSHDRGVTFPSIISLLISGTYGYKYLPNGVVSFNFSEEKGTNNSGDISIFPIACFLILQFSNSLGVSTVPNMLVSEMFPFK